MSVYEWDRERNEHSRISSSCRSDPVFPVPVGRCVCVCVVYSLIGLVSVCKEKGWLMKSQFHSDLHLHFSLLCWVQCKLLKQTFCSNCYRIKNQFNGTWNCCNLFLDLLHDVEFPVKNAELGFPPFTIQSVLIVWSFTLTHNIIIIWND